MKPPSLEKLAAIELSLSRERGGFVFFGLVQREDSTLWKWDLVVAAPWLEPYSFESLSVIADALRATMIDEMTALSFIAVLGDDSPFLQDVITLVPPVEHGLIELNNESIAEMDIRKAYVITCRGRLAPKPKGRKKSGRTAAK
jgi:hypothetical protein